MLTRARLQTRMVRWFSAKSASKSATTTPSHLKKLAFFDCDYTCIANDCEMTWKALLVQQQWADPASFALSVKYRDLHDAGALPEKEWVEFLLKEFKGRTWHEMSALFTENTAIVEKYIYPAVRDWMTRYERTVLLSASVRPIVEPIGRKLGVHDVICTNILRDPLTHRFTGSLDGPFMLGVQKLKAAQAYIGRYGVNLQEVSYFGDSVSDLPLLEKVAD